MKRAREKLHSTAGITFLFGLVVFLLASMASLTILTVALNNVHRVDEQRQAQRELLAASSAAALMREKLSDQEVTIKQILDLNMEERDPDERTVEGSDALAVALAVAMLDSAAYDEKLTLSDGGEQSMTVNIHYSGTRVTMTFTPADPEDGEVSAAPMSLVFDGARLREESLVPHYEYELVDPVTDEYDWVLKYWIRTSSLSFDANRIYAKAEQGGAS